MTADPQSQSSEPLQRGRLTERERKGESEGEGETRAHPSRYKRETQSFFCVRLESQNDSRSRSTKERISQSREEPPGGRFKIHKDFPPLSPRRKHPLILSAVNGIHVCVCVREKD